MLHLVDAESAEKETEMTKNNDGIEIVKQDGRWFITGLDMGCPIERARAVCAYRTKKAAIDDVTRTRIERAAESGR